MADGGSRLDGADADAPVPVFDKFIKNDQAEVLRDFRRGFNSHDPDLVVPVLERLPAERLGRGGVDFPDGFQRERLELPPSLFEGLEERGDGVRLPDLAEGERGFRGRIGLGVLEVLDQGSDARLLADQTERLGGPAPDPGVPALEARLFQKRHARVVGDRAERIDRAVDNTRVLVGQERQEGLGHPGVLEALEEVDGLAAPLKAPVAGEFPEVGPLVGRTEEQK